LRSRVRAFALGLAHALLFALAFPPVGWWWMAFVAPLPLLMLAVRPGRSPVSAGFWGMLGVLPFWVWTHAWIGEISMAGVYPLVVYLSLYAWAFVVIGARAARARVMPPAFGLALAWVGLEFFRARIGWSGYPWYLSGHPLIESPGLAWPAAVGGVSLVSLLVVLPGAWWAARRRTPVWASAVTGVLLFAWLGLGLWWGMSTPASSGHAVRVGIVQTNVPQDNRMSWTVEQRLMDWLVMRDLTVELAMQEPPPELIVWPEGLVPGWTIDPVALAHERARGIVWRLNPQTEAEQAAIGHYGSQVPATQVVDEMLAMQRALGVPMLVGAVAYENLDIVSGPRGIEYDSDAVFNSVFLLRSGRVADVWYDKLHLTPFGETMPYISAWPWLERRLLSIGAEGMSFGLDSGRSVRTIPLELGGARDGVQIATPICFEATMPAVCRRLVKAAAAGGRPVFLVNVTNDGWFGNSRRGRLMHELSARWRCIELGLPMVRCANTGVSGLIDRRGAIVDRLDDRQAGTRIVRVEPGRPATLFLRVGEWAGWVCLLALPGLVWSGRKLKNGEPAPAAG
jgi:apolipoprotein N-acyltransferase